MAQWRLKESRRICTERGHRLMSVITVSMNCSEGTDLKYPSHEAITAVSSEWPKSLLLFFDMPLLVLRNGTPGTTYG